MSDAASPPEPPLQTNVSCEACRALLAAGATALDVRTPEEFELGRVPGSLNVPYQLAEGDRLIQNPAFRAAVEQRFGRDAPLVLVCHSGARAAQACALLHAWGFFCVRVLQHGFDGSRDHFGRLRPGWRRLGLPCEAGPT